MPSGVEMADVDQRLEPDLRGRARRRLLGDLLEELVLTVQDRVAELLLALEVVVEATAGDSGPAQDLRGRRTGVPGPVDHDSGGLDEPQDHLLAAVSAVPVLLHRCDASLGRVRRYLRVRQHAPGTQPDATHRRTSAAPPAPSRAWPGRECRKRKWAPYAQNVTLKCLCVMPLPACPSPAKPLRPVAVSLRSRRAERQGRPTRPQPRRAASLTTPPHARRSATKPS